jgi:hypothetical protein
VGGRTLNHLVREHAVALMVLFVVLAQFPVINAQTMQVVTNALFVMHPRPVSMVSSPAAAEQVSITNKGNSADYPTSFQASQPELTVTIRWSQNFDSTEVRYDVLIVESSTNLGAGLSSNLSAGEYSGIFQNAYFPYVTQRTTWTLIARVNATDRAGLTLTDQYRWTVTVQNVPPVSTSRSATRSSSHSVVTTSTIISQSSIVSKSSVVTQSSVVSQTSSMSHSTPTPQFTEFPIVPVAAIILTLFCLAILQSRRTSHHKSND